MARFAFRLLLLAALAAAALGGLAWGGSRALTDSADLWRRAEEVALFAQRIDPYVDPDLTYPPSAPPIFAALIAPVPARALPAAWLGLNLAALAALGVGMLALWTPGWTWLDRALLILAVAATKPVRAGLALGQFHLIPTALAVWAILALRSGRAVLAGLLLGVALIKPTMVLPLLGLWMVQGRWRAVASALGVQAALGLATSAWVGVGPLGLLREWLANAKDQEVAGTLDLPSLAALAWPGLPISGSLLSLAALAGCVALLAALRRADDATLGALAIGLGAIFAYHRHYDLVLLLPALACLADASRLGDRTARVAQVLLALAWITPSQPITLRGFDTAHAVVSGLAAYLALAVLARSAARQVAALGPPALLDAPSTGGYDEPGPPMRRACGTQTLAGPAPGSGSRRDPGRSFGLASRDGRDSY